MSVKVEKNGNGARVSTKDKVIELENVDEIRTAILGLEGVLEDIVTSWKRGK